MKAKPQLNFIYNFIFLLPLILISTFGHGQTAVVPIGTGTSDNPYQIATLENLYWIQQNSVQWDKHFIQTSDIDAAATSTWFSGGGFPTIAESSSLLFTGVYNGNGKIIFNLYMNRIQSDGCSLFGHVSGSTARIQYLGLVNLNYTFNTTQMIGGIVGRLNAGAKVQNCFTTGNLSGTGHIGGIVGNPSGTGVSIEQCWSSVTINSTYTSTSSSRMVGGIAGWVTTSITQDCYFSGSISWISASVRAGGISGYLNNNTPITEISRSYSIGNILGTAGIKKGAVIGEAAANPFATGGVFFDNELISLNGVGYGTLATGSSVVGRSTSEMKNQSNYPQWDFSTIWGINPNINYGYPYLRQNLPYIPPPDCNDYLAETPILDNGVYQVSTFKHLRWISENSSSWGADFIQTADIDATVTGESCYNSGEGWLPIGNVSTKFTGTYNGDGHTISNVSINRSGSSIALFGQTDGAIIHNLGLINHDITVTGSGSGLGSNTGSLVGLADNGTSITQCFATGGSVTAEGAGVGGLIGQLWNSSLNNSYAIVAVDGATDQYSAGLVGINTSSSIINSYAAGSVVLNQVQVSPGTFVTYSQGLTQNNGGTISNSFYDSQATGQSTGSGTSKTTSEMQQQATFTNWDFQCEAVNGTVNIWGIDESNDYPRLSWVGFTQDCTVQWMGTISSDWNIAGNWSNQQTPNAFSNVIIVATTNQPSAVSSIEVTTLQVNNGSSLTIEPLSTLKVNGNIINNGQIIFKSDATGSGSFDQFNGTITGTGTIQVERYIPSKRAFRFVSPSVTTTSSIRDNWQENGGTAAGLGTHITGTGGVADGFDTTATNNPSMFGFDSNTGQWSAVTNTNVNTFTAGTPYRLMVRGDRTTDLTTNMPTATATTLRVTGSLKTGDFTPALNQAAEGFSFIGNPYQAPLDMEAVLINSSTNINTDVLYYWDPTINTRGGYVTRTLSVNSNNVSSSFTEILQPGQAVFVKKNNTATTATITISETHKSVADVAAGVFRNSNNNSQSNIIGLLRANLQATINNEWQTTDAALALFATSYTWDLTQEDAVKMNNLDEEVSFIQNNMSLAIAKQNEASATDELPIRLKQLRHMNYRWVFDLTNYNGNTPYLLDLVTNTYAEITNETTIPFTVIASNNENRFKIVFQNGTLSTDDFVKNIKIYPNPTKTGTSFYVSGITEGIVSVFNVVGQNIPVAVMRQGNAIQVTPTTTLSQGIYLVSVITTDGKTAQVKWIVE